MRLSERVRGYTQESIERYRTKELKRLRAIAQRGDSPACAQLLERIASAPAEELATKMATQDRQLLRRRNASAEQCGAPTKDAAYSDDRIVSAIEQIAACDFDSERECDHLVALVSQHLLDPNWLDYLYYPDDHGLTDDLEASDVFRLARGFQSGSSKVVVAGSSMCPRGTDSVSCLGSGADS